MNRSYDAAKHIAPFPLDKIYQSDGVDIWLVESESIREEDIPELSTLLDLVEMERYRRFKNDNAQKEFITGKLATRHLFSYYRPEIPPKEWRFATNHYGKPFQSEPKCRDPLHFNLSHSNGLVAICIGDKREIGVDIERIHTVSTTRELAEQCFSDDELTTFYRLDSSLRNEYFFTLWTLKEAYIKARGMGVSLDLKSFSISFNIENTDTISLTTHDTVDTNHNPWNFKSFTPEAGYKMAIAFR